MNDGQMLATGELVGAWYAAHHGWLRGWLRGRTNCGERAADLAHDTFLRVLRRGVLTAAEPRAYLRTVAQGLLVDQWRRQALEAAWLETLAAQPADAAPSAEDSLLALRALEAAERMLAGLRPRVREAFLLAQVEGMTYREVAERLGVGERSIKNYMAEAMLHCLRHQAEPA